MRSAKENTKKKPKRPKWISWLPYVLLPALVYFGNVELQSYLGRKALNEADLNIITFDEALKVASRENKLVLADMSAIWCPTCRRLDQNVLAKDEVKKAIADKYIFSRIEYESDKGKAFMRKYQVSGFPTLLVLDSEGNKIRKLPLTFSPEEFVSYL